MFKPLKSVKLVNIIVKYLNSTESQNLFKSRSQFADGLLVCVFFRSRLSVSHTTLVSSRLLLAN